MTPDQDLFTPSLQGHAPGAAKALPWRVTSQFWPAFFGGSLAVGAIAWLNGKRLGLAPERQRWIAVSTFLAFVLSAFLLVSFVTGARESRIWMRRGLQVVGVALYLVLARIQQPGDRRHQMFEGKYASLWVPGSFALVGSVVVMLGVIFTTVWVTSP